jgi:hypothetical protein
MELGGVVGDAVHNIRAALDYVAVVISCPPFGSGNPRNVYFPTGKSRPKFIEARDGKGNPGAPGYRKGKMAGAGAEALRLVDELEPYDGGKYAIRALHDLDIADKHELLIPAASLLHVNELAFKVKDKYFSISGTDFSRMRTGPISRPRAI